MSDDNNITSAAIVLPEPGVPSLWHRLRYTPLRDVLRGRMSARLDARLTIANAKLPKPLAEITWRVVRGTRLWRSEKVAVAEELTSHFLDGIDAGKTPDELLEAFGDPRIAAKLIRRAKKRARSWTWKSFKGLTYTAIALLAVYALLWVRLLWRESSLDSQQYADIITAMNAAVPEDQQAWPEYRRIFAKYELARLDWRKYSDFTYRDINVFRDEAAWTEMVAYFDANQPMMTELRAAAHKPYLAQPIESITQFTEADIAAFWSGDTFHNDPRKPSVTHPTFRMQDIGGVFIAPGLTPPYLIITKLLKFDLLAAIEQRDRQRVVDDIAALLAFGRQSISPPNNKLYLSGARPAEEAYSKLSDILCDPSGSGFLTDEDLKTLAHQIAASSDIYEPEFTIARLTAQEQLDDFYSRGGKITASALNQTSDRVLQFNWLSPLLGQDVGQQVGFIISMPVLALLADDRQAAEQLVDRYFAAAQAAAERPLWESSPDDSYILSVFSIEEQTATMFKLRHGYLVSTSLFFPIRYMKVLQAGQQAVLAAIALELYHRQHGRYPASLAELSPRYLPEPPIDHSTGKPLLFTIGENGKPIIYGRGRDGDDDGGMPQMQNKDYPPRTANRWDGDWILVPRDTRIQDY